jgi:hypothetical protein
MAGALRRAPGYMAIRRLSSQWELVRWQLRGRPAPPPRLIKQQIVRQYARDFGLDALVETGTYFGEMIAATQDLFRDIWSIEIEPWLHQRAQKVFAAKPHIHLLLGDSRDVLPQVLEQLDRPALFWLDGHFSGGITGKGISETPIVQELDAIARHPVKQHVLLIDDARDFTGKNDYPSIEQMRQYVGERFPARVFQLENDIIRIHFPRG